MSDPVTAAADKVYSHTVMYGALLHAAGLHVPKSRGLPTLVMQRAIWLQDLVQRLESITIHWTRQIKEVVNQQVTAASIVDHASKSDA